MPETPDTFPATPTVDTVYIQAAYDHLTGRFFSLTGDDDDQKAVHQSPLIDDLVAKITAALREERDGAEVVVYLASSFGFPVFSSRRDEKARHAVITALDLAAMCPKPDPRYTAASQAVFSAGYFAALSDLKAAKNL